MRDFASHSIHDGTCRLQRNRDNDLLSPATQRRSLGSKHQMFKMTKHRKRSRSGFPAIFFACSNDPPPSRLKVSAAFLSANTVPRRSLSHGVAVVQENNGNRNCSSAPDRFHEAEAVKASYSTSDLRRMFAIIQKRMLRRGSCESG